MPTACFCARGRTDLGRCALELTSYVPPTVPRVRTSALRSCRESRRAKLIRHDSARRAPRSSCSWPAVAVPGHVQYDNNRCLIDGQTATLRRGRGAAGDGGGADSGAAALVRRRHHASSCSSPARRTRRRQSCWYCAQARRRATAAGRSAFATRSIDKGRARCASAPSSARRSAFWPSRRAVTSTSTSTSGRRSARSACCSSAIWRCGTSEEQGVLAEQRKNLNKRFSRRPATSSALVEQAAAGGEAEGARGIVAQLNGCAGAAGQIVGRLPVALRRAAEGAQGAHRRRRREGFVVAVDGIRRAQVAAGDADLGEGVRRVDAKLATQDGDIKALQAQLADLDAQAQTAPRPPRLRAAKSSATAAASPKSAPVAPPRSRRSSPKRPPISVPPPQRWPAQLRCVSNINGASRAFPQSNADVGRRYRGRPAPPDPATQRRQAEDLSMKLRDARVLRGR